MAPLNIAIIGAGIGGPAAAIALAKNGHNVTIYERATSTEGVGFAFRITPNSDRCLKFLGIDVQEKGAVKANTVRILTSEGKVLPEIRENDGPGIADQGVFVFAYRVCQVNIEKHIRLVIVNTSQPSLQEQLIQRVLESGVPIKTGAKVALVDTERTKLKFEDDSEVYADLIVAADGVHVRLPV
jgi:2-polyprenyl-6-methoxyphenol hydroxylase-like FAD-dependent oxidoreductase